MVNRSEFDHWLVQQAEAAGVTVDQEESILGVRARREAIEVETSSRIIKAGIVVGA
ncbi:MAG: hypothetical protein GWO24_29160, partial [Akkermansiaceae bacterium]|nr:hypothetical protein [Akkermansiaceae bacterium]